MTLLKFDHCTATQILREIQFWRIQTVQKWHFWQFQRLRTFNLGKFGTWKLLKLTKNQNSEPLKLPKWHFWTVWICQNMISRKIAVAVKWSKFNKVKPNFTFWKFLEHSGLLNIGSFQKWTLKILTGNVYIQTTVSFPFVRWKFN